MRTFRLPVIVLLAALVLAGCFQPGGEGIQATPIGQGPVIPPTATATATQVPPSPVPPTADTEAQPLAQATTPPSVFNTAAPVDGQGGALVQASPTAPVSGAALTATAMIAQAQSLQGQATQPPAAVQIATATPFVDPNLAEGNLIATQMVAGATATGFAVQTAQATMAGVLPPTLTPTPTTTLLAAQALPAGGDCIHVVKRGENTFRIALRYGLTIADIARANGLANATLISVGQELTIPGCGNQTPTPSVPAGDATGGGLGETGGTCGEHLIQPGENLYRIALRYGVTMNALRNVNSLSNVNVIKAGDVMIIPCQ